jgi:hypothetical protein
MSKKERQAEMGLAHATVLSPAEPVRPNRPDLAAAGPPVVALTEAAAAIQSSTGAITIYRRHNKPALGPPETPG